VPDGQYKLFALRKRCKKACEACKEFDINTPYKFRNILKDNVFYDISDEITYVWQNRFDSKKKICEFDITFFIKEGKYYKKYDEVHYERCYEIDEF